MDLKLYHHKITLRIVHQNQNNKEKKIHTASKIYIILLTNQTDPVHELDKVFIKKCEYYDN